MVMILWEIMNGYDLHMDLKLGNTLCDFVFYVLICSFASLDRDTESYVAMCYISVLHLGSSSSHIDRKWPEFVLRYITLYLRFLSSLLVSVCIRISM